jgi:hypothetical protein
VSSPVSGDFLGATKRIRLDEIIRRLNELPAFSDGDTARKALEDSMRSVEDELSGIPENPNAATSPPDGRIYPPHDLYEKDSRSPQVRLFKQTGRQTWFGANGALRIERSNGVAEVDKPGADQKTIADLLSENSNDNE